MLTFEKMMGAFNRLMLEPATDKTLSRAVSRYFSKRDPDERKPGIHVSDFSDPCIRRLAFKVLQPNVRDPSGTPASQRNFEEGKAGHYWWQNKIYGPMGILSGKWECSVCKRHAIGFMPEIPCTNKITIYPVIDETAHLTCKDLGARWEFSEQDVEITIDGITIVGNSDGLIYWGGEWYILEIKTMRSDVWKILTRPDPSHHLQASIYALLLKQDKVLISYVEKGTWRTKDFPRPKLSTTLPWMDDHIQLAKKYSELGPLQAPARCAKKDSARARRCGFSSQCFAS